MTLIVALIFGMLLASSLIFLGFDLMSNQTNSLLYKKVKIVSTLVDTYKAYKEKKSSRFFDVFLGRLKASEEESSLMTKQEYIESSKRFRDSLDAYFEAIKDAQSIEIIDAQPRHIDEIKEQTVRVLADLEKIREYIRDLHLEGVKASSNSRRSLDSIRRITEEESNAFRALSALSPASSDEGNWQEDRNNQRPRRN